MYFCCSYDSPVGTLTLASNGTELTGLWIQGQKHFAKNHSGPIEQPELPVFQQTVLWLDRYFAGERVTPDLLPLRPEGSTFQQKVWDILKTVPWGQTLTYGQIAKHINCPGGSQAVGSAVGCNPISIIIPCHRVLGSGGKLTGYAGGLAAKVRLLTHEGILNPGEVDGNLTRLPL